MKEIKLNVEGMTCGGCENRIKNALSEIEGVESVVANHETNEVTITLNAEVEEETLKEIITDLGFEVVE